VVAAITDKEIALEILKCEKYFTHFLSYCRITDTPTSTNPGGIIPFELYPHTKKVIATLLNYRLIDIIKSKQVGMSWLVGGAWVLWNAMYKYGDRTLMYSAGEREAIELMSKGKQIYEHLPEWMQIKTGKDSTMLMTFPLVHSQIVALPSTEKAGIGEKASRVICDEWAFHPCAEANYFNSKPTVDAGGQFIGMTTVDPSNPDSLATSIFTDAQNGLNDFVPLFLGWDSMPSRTQEWYDGVKQNIPTRNLNGLTPDLYMSKNYPRTIDEALSLPETVAAFDYKVLDLMAEKTKNPEKGFPEIDENICHIYRPFLQGEPYIASSDASHGVGQDYAITVIMDTRTGEVVADIMSKVLPPESLAYHSVKLLSLYKNPKWFPEDNDWGRTVITEAQKLGYNNFGYQDDKKTKEGFHTGIATRLPLWGELIMGINNRQITIYNKDGLKQFYDVFRNAKESGRIEARQGRHDDYPVAVGICWLKRTEIETGEWKPKTINSLTFNRDNLPAFLRR
jgi:hypothetical protein